MKTNLEIKLFSFVHSHNNTCYAKQDKLLMKITKLAFKIALLIIFLFVSNQVIAQFEGLKWINTNWPLSASNVTLYEFGCDGISELQTTNISTGHDSLPLFPTTSICNDDGELLFFANAINVYNKEFKIMKNGEQSMFSQNDIYIHNETRHQLFIIPSSVAENIYFIYVIREVNHTSSNNYFDISRITINMTLDNKKGAVIKTEKQIEKIEGVN
jgi:hypothetical protein